VNSKVSIIFLVDVALLFVEAGISIFFMPHIEVSKGRGSTVNLYYETHGNGPCKILLVTGFMTHCGFWMPQINFLTQFEEFEVCLFDNRGFGMKEIIVECK